MGDEDGHSAGSRRGARAKDSIENYLIIRRSAPRRRGSARQSSSFRVCPNRMLKNSVQEG